MPGSCWSKDCTALHEECWRASLPVEVGEHRAIFATGGCPLVGLCPAHVSPRQFLIAREVRDTTNPCLV